MAIVKIAVKTVFLVQFLLVSAFLASHAQAATYNLPNTIPSGCSSSGSTVTCSGLSLAQNDIVNVTGSVTWKINGSIHFANAKVNQSGGGVLTIQIADDLYSVSGFYVVADFVIQDEARFDYSNTVIGKVTAKKLFIASDNKITGDLTSTGGDISLGSRTQTVGRIQSDSKVTFESDAKHTGSVSAKKEVLLNSRVTVSGSVSTNENIRLESEARVEQGLTAGSSIVLKARSKIFGCVTAGDDLRLESDAVEIHGNVVVQDELDVEHMSRIYGDIYAGDLDTYSNGVLLDGNVFIKDEVDLGYGTTITGNLTYGDDLDRAGNVTINGIVRRANVSPNSVTCSSQPAEQKELYWSFNQQNWNGTSGEVTEASDLLVHGTSAFGASTSNQNPAYTDSSGAGTCYYGVFSGSSSNSDTVLMNKNDVMNTANTFTLSFWLKMPSGSGTQAIAIYGKDANNNFANNRFGVMAIDGALYFGVVQANGSVLALTVPGASLHNVLNNSWGHVAVTYSKNGKMRLYINAILKAEINAGSQNLKDISAVSGAAFSVGAFPNSTYGMTGNVDEVRFQNKELSQSEIEALRIASTSCPTYNKVLSFDLNKEIWTGTAGEVFDSSGNNLHGRTYGSINSSLINPALVMDINGDGTCYFSSFNGTNQYIEVPDNSKLDFRDQYTASIWIRPTSYAPTNGLMSILSKDTNYEFHLNPQGKIYWWWKNSNGEAQFLTSNGTIPLNRWSHIAVRYSKGSQRIFINGEADSATSSYTNILTTNNEPLQIGWDREAGRYFKGDLDEIRIFDYALTQLQITDVMNERKPCTAEENCLFEPFDSQNQWFASRYGNSTLPSVVPNTGNSSNPNRLRLTSKDNNQATSMTFKRRFEGAGNRVSIEFTYYSWKPENVNGADGIAVVLSEAPNDANNGNPAYVPAPGSFGGSLGYAQRKTVSNKGFNKGWLGIGLDEYGNYSSAKEGAEVRTGGPGFYPNTVGVRGSEASGYAWLQGAQFGNNLDAVSSTPAPGHRYKVIIDSTAQAAQDAKVDVYRATNSLAQSPSYGNPVMSFNLSNYPNQTPPEFFYLSLTGSTGSSVNYHEVDEFKVCSVKPPRNAVIEAQVHHFEISYGSQGLTCEPSVVTVKACANASCSELYSGQVTLTVGATGGATGSGFNNNSVNFTGGTVSLSLSKTSSADTQFSILQSSVLVSNPLICKERNSTNPAGELDPACTLSFASSGLLLSDIPTQIAGKTSSAIKLQVVQAGSGTGACEVRDVENLPVQFSYQCVNPGSCIAGQTFTVDGAAIQPLNTFTSINREFNQNAETNFQIEYSDVGKVRLHAKLTLPGESAPLEVSSNEFVVKPAKIVVADVSRADDTANPATTSSGAGFVAAGEEFKVVLEVQNDRGKLTPNFGNELERELLALDNGLIYPTFDSGQPCQTAGPDCEPNPALTIGAGGFTALAGGRFGSSEVSWNQVGAILLSGKISDDTYIDADTSTIFKVKQNVGRFYPDRFELVSKPAEVINSCSAGNFSYMGQSAISVEAGLQAVSKNGSVVTNYNSLPNKPYQNTAAIGVIALNASGSDNRGDRFDNKVATAWKDGVWLWQQSDLRFSKLATLTPDGPYSSLQMGLAVLSEADNRNLQQTVGFPGAAIGQPLDMRYGRFALLNAAGPEDEDLPVVLQAEYWNGSQFDRNTVDSCSIYAASNLDVTGITTAKGGSSGSMVTGQNQFLGIFIPAPGVPGTATMQYLIPPALNYLQFPWNGGTVLTNPVAEAQFGRHQGNKRQIFWQERLN